jgi:hypothetical protein
MIHSRHGSRIGFDRDHNVCNSASDRYETLDQDMMRTISTLKTTFVFVTIRSLANSGGRALQMQLKH